MRYYSPDVTGDSRLHQLSTVSRCLTVGAALQNTVDKLVQRANASFLVSTSSWKEQFVEAITVSAGERRRRSDSWAAAGAGPRY